jgi:hypothetical protein
MLDGFGVTQSFSIKDNAGVTNPIGTLGYYRSGADNSGTFRLVTYKTGTPTTRLEIDPVCILCAAQHQRPAKSRSQHYFF